MTKPCRTQKKKQAGTSDSCYLCGKDKFHKIEGRVRDNPGLDVMECLSCGLVFLSSNDHITDDFYRESGIHEKPVAIETLLSDSARDDERRFTFLRDSITGKSVLDFGCGAGGFLALARGAASGVAGIELEERMKRYLAKKGLVVYSNIDEAACRFDVITLFHVLEHMKDPIECLKKLAKKLNGGGRIIVEVPSARDAMLKLYGCKAFSEFTYWSCHLFYFTNETISAVAKKSGLGIEYIRQVQRYPLPNHLYWLAAGKPGGHKIWSFMDSEDLNRLYERLLASKNNCDTIVASLSKGLKRGISDGII